MRLPAVLPRWALLLCGLAGCAANQIVSMAPPASTPRAKDYVDHFKRWSRHGDLRADFDATLIVDATMHSPELQAAYLAKYLDVYKVTESSRASVTKEVNAGMDEGWVFHVENQAHTYELTELGKRSLWRVTLLDDRNREVAASSLISDPRRPEFLQAFYPYNTVFSRAWRVVFPKKMADGSELIGPDTRTLTLRIAGPAGSVDLVWRFRETK